jgi:hypothetical protein
VADSDTCTVLKYIVIFFHGKILHLGKNLVIKYQSIQKKKFLWKNFAPWKNWVFAFQTVFQ